MEPSTSSDPPPHGRQGAVEVEPAGRKPRVEADSIIEYALANQLTVNFQEQTADKVANAIWSLQKSVPPLKNGEIISSRRLAECNIPEPRIPDDEGDFETEESCLLLAEILHSRFPETSITFHNPSSETIRKLQLELPILRSNVNLDMEREADEISMKQSAILKHHHLPLDPVNIEEDEGIDFPAWAKNLPRAFHEALEKEHLDHKLDDGDKNIVKGPLSLEKITSSATRGEVSMNVINDEFDAMAVCMCRPTAYTPPLSPEPLEIEQFIPSEEVCHIDCPSDPSTLIDEDLENAEAVLNGITGNDFPTDDELDNFVKLSPSPHRPILFDDRARTPDQKMEVPFPKLGSSPSHDRDPLEILSQVYRDGMMLSCVKVEEEEEKEFESSAEDIPHFFEDGLFSLLTSKSEETNRSAEQEKLQVFESLAQVPVPAMDFSVSPLYWERVPESPQGHLARILRPISSLFRCTIKETTREQKKRLRWNPFTPGAGKIPDEGPIRDDKGQLREYLVKYAGSDVAMLDHDAMRQPGILKFLERSPDDDDEILPLQPVRKPSPTQDLQRPTQKRKGGDIAEAMECSKRIKPRASKPKELVHGASLLLDPSDANAAGSLVSSYMSLRAPEKLAPTTSSYFSKSLGASPPRTETPSLHAQIPRTVNKNTQVPSPPFELPSDQGRFIISLELGHSLAHRIEHHYPGVELLDRDFRKHNTFAWSPGSTDRKEIPSLLSFEADISLSPATGVLVTTLAKVRQRPLPGSNQPNKLREKVSKVARLYEKLVVLVSEGNADNEFSETLSLDDVKAYGDFIAFTSSQKEIIHVIFVGGGEDTLAKWIVALMCKHHHETDQTRRVIILDESTWEVFLRRVGMNVYAAQVVIGALKSTLGTRGLIEFLKMDQDERIRRLEQFMGGKRVLDRVGTVLDRAWG